MKTRNEEAEGILIEEDAAGIAKLYSDAEKRAVLMNKVCRIARIQSYSDYTSIVRDVDGYVKHKMLEDPEVKKLSKLVPVEQMIVPDQYMQLKRFVALYPDPDSIMKDLVYEGGEWSIDKATLKQKENHYRKFATTENQAAKYFACKALCDFLNGQRIGNNNWGSFDSIMVERRSTELGKFFPNARYILAAEDTFMS